MKENKFTLIIGLIVLIGALIGIKMYQIQIDNNDIGKPYLEYYECGYLDMCRSHGIITPSSFGPNHGEKFPNEFEAFVQGYKDAFDMLWKEPWGSWDDFNKASEDGTIDGMYHDMDHITKVFKAYYPDYEL